LQFGGGPSIERNDSINNVGIYRQLRERTSLVAQARSAHLPAYNYAKHDSEKKSVFQPGDRQPRLGLAEVDELRVFGEQ
jgi:hypothetical protein